MARPRARRLSATAATAPLTTFPLARKKAAESHTQSPKTRHTPEGVKKNVVSAQNAAKVRTGTYTDKPGSARPKATPTTSATPERTARKPYGNGSGSNPYGRYSASDNGEDASYTASYKPNAGKDAGNEKDKASDTEDKA